VGGGGGGWCGWTLEVLRDSQQVGEIKQHANECFKGPVSRNLGKGGVGRQRDDK
jgi:hypothetical protein